MPYLDMTMLSESETEQLWRSAASFQELCELTARYVCGELAFHPMQCGPIDSETKEIEDFIEAFNLAGFLTYFSQPASSFGPFSQRAAVSGFALPHVATEIEKIGLYSDLYVVVLPHGVNLTFQVPVTLDYFHPFTWCGADSWDEVEIFAQTCGSRAMTESCVREG